MPILSMYVYDFLRNLFFLIKYYGKLEEKITYY